MSYMYEPNYERDEDDEPSSEEWNEMMGGRIQFANPGRNSALRAATRRNPRNLPCPTCGAENVLTPADRARHYQCDSCADKVERHIEW